MRNVATTACRVLSIVAALTVWAGLAAPARGVDRADRAFDEATHALDNGDYDVAIDRLNEAVRLAPKEAKCVGLRGVAWLRKKEYAKGTADLKAAIALHPEDAGAAYRPTADRRLSDEAVRHGREQVAAMLRDRPAMAEFGPEAQFLRDWAVRKFAGEDLGSPIDWDPSPPLHSDAEHIAPCKHENAAILVAADYDSGPNQGKPRRFEELWAGAVYELHNVCFADQFVRFNKQAEQGRISKRDFVAGIVKFELQAAQQTRAFYLQVLLPWIEKKKLATDPALWFCDWWDTPKGVLHTFTNQSTYPWRPYSRMHDWATVHLGWRLGKFNKAYRLLRQMQNEEGYQEDEAEVYYWSGRCLERLGRPVDAITALSESIRLAPEDATAYLARARIYQRLGEQDKAQADLKRAKELEKDEGMTKPE
jgi:tetratricopeptide (TPR) repeat protein